MNVITVERRSVFMKQEYVLVRTTLQAPSVISVLRVFITSHSVMLVTVTEEPHCLKSVLLPTGSVSVDLT